MADYIERKKLKDKLNNTNILWSIKCKPKVKEQIGSLVEDICKNYLRIINNMPSVDAVEVVRCKDCKYRIKNYCTRLSQNANNYFLFVKDTDFCKWGEKDETQGETS